MLVTMVFQTLYFLIDLYWVGHLGKEAVAAVGVAGNLSFIVLAATQMLGVGTTTLVSHAAGRKRRDEALAAFNQAQVLAMSCGVLFAAVGMLLRPRYAAALSADPLTARLAGDYLLWFVPAMGLQFGMVAMGAALRGTGNFKPGMIVQTATVLINMLLAPFLIFGWVTNRPLGVAGAALSTLIAVVIGVIWLAWFFRSRTAYLHFHPADWRPRLDLWRRMLGVGLPAGTEFALMAVYLFIVYAVSRPFGAAAQAGFGIGMRLVQAGFLPVVALGFAVAPVAGQNFGAGHGARVRQTFRTGALMASAWMLVWALVCHAAAAPMIAVFSADPPVVAVGVEYLRIVSWSFVASGVVFVASSTFQALGNTLPPLATSFARMVAVAVPVTAMTRFPGFDLRWVWYLSVASIGLQVALSLLLLEREFRVRLPLPGQPGDIRLA
jgi:putative MATE family efflux protein